MKCSQLVLEQYTLHEVESGMTTNNHRNSYKNNSNQRNLRGIFDEKKKQQSSRELIALTACSESALWEFEDEVLAQFRGKHNI